MDTETVSQWVHDVKLLGVRKNIRLANIIHCQPIMYYKQRSLGFFRRYSVGRKYLLHIFAWPMMR